MGIDCKKVWNQSKNKMPPHQAMITEVLINQAGSYDICWTCGDDERLYYIKVKNSDGEIGDGIMCADCALESKKAREQFLLRKNQLMDN